LFSKTIASSDVPMANGRYTPPNNKPINKKEIAIINSANTVSVLLVSAPGLEQAALYTAVNAIPHTTIVAKTSRIPSALLLAQQYNPDLLLADAAFLKDEMAALLVQMKNLRPNMISVALTAVTSPSTRLQQNGADYVLDYSNLSQNLPCISRNVQEPHN